MIIPNMIAALTLVLLPLASAFDGELTLCELAEDGFSSHARRLECPGKRSPLCVVDDLAKTDCDIQFCGPYSRDCIRDQDEKHRTQMGVTGCHPFEVAVSFTHKSTDKKCILSIQCCSSGKFTLDGELALRHQRSRDGKQLWKDAFKVIDEEIKLVKRFTMKVHKLTDNITKLTKVITEVSNSSKRSPSIDLPAGATHEEMSKLNSLVAEDLEERKMCQQKKRQRMCKDLNHSLDCTNTQFELTKTELGDLMKTFQAMVTATKFNEMKQALDHALRCTRVTASCPTCSDPHVLEGKPDLYRRSGDRANHRGNQSLKQLFRDADNAKDFIDDALPVNYGRRAGEQCPPAGMGPKSAKKHH